MTLRELIDALLAIELRHSSGTPVVLMDPDGCHNSPTFAVIATGTRVILLGKDMVAEPRAGRRS